MAQGAGAAGEIRQIRDVFQADAKLAPALAPVLAFGTSDGLWF